KEIHTKTGKYYKEADEKHAVGKYAVTEVELPGLMEAHGFKNIETHYTAVNLTPDSEQYEKNFALRMIEANRQMELDGVKYINAIAPNVCSDDEINLWNKEINKRYDTRIKQYNLGLKQWDVSLSLTMIVKGTK
ncbi:MAG: hypothetical protein FWC95_05745, partial [Defluviitaleaceae bacterium]|nr:hypothetical protein [Defluviitaleaceae bacterium]